jgi:hypothetical protein
MLAGGLIVALVFIVFILEKVKFAKQNLRIIHSLASIYPKVIPFMVLMFQNINH